MLVDVGAGVATDGVGGRRGRSGRRREGGRRGRSGAGEALSTPRASGDTSPLTRSLRAQVGGRDSHRLPPRQAPLGRAVVARDPVALPARRAVVEQRRAQRRRVRPVPGPVQVPVPARAAHRAGDVAPAVERRRAFGPPAVVRRRRWHQRPRRGGDDDEEMEA